ncbi:hypothetical protein PISMIDRAFT_18711 [Pisolithus microcarpus 441]|uniref:Uncharacterized protein n=1 Tax=Pisolithus microcarpus 441 TaxID=765257 RepID=A0A0C9YF34_9AGAM|nr:hypothetical protein PISMIDRAFT_18711 [Pisolithus microcarpus 441]
MISFGTRAKEEEWVGELKNEGKVAEQDEGEQKREEEKASEQPPPSHNDVAEVVIVQKTTSERTTKLRIINPWEIDAVRTPIFGRQESFQLWIFGDESLDEFGSA